MLIAGQLFWIGRVVDLGERFSPGKPRRALLTAIASVVCLFFFAYNIAPYISPWEIPRGDSTHSTLRHVLFEAPFWCWFVGSWLGFALVMVFWTVDRAGRFSAASATMRSILKPRIPSHDSLPPWGFASSVKSGHSFNRTAKC